MWNDQTVSVVLPAYNEELSIYGAVNDFFQTGLVDEVVVVDNNSKDRTVEQVRRTKATIVHELKQGYGAALTRGLREAKGDIIVLAEPDGTFQSGDLIKLLAYSQDCDMVCGTRTTRELIWAEANMGWFLRVGNFVVAKMLEFLFNTCSLSDCGCTFRLIRRSAVETILPHLTVTGSHFLPQMVTLAAKLHVSFIEIPLNYRPRIGTSKITGSWKGVFTTGFRMIALIWSERFRVLSRADLAIPAPAAKGREKVRIVRSAASSRKRR